MPELCDRAGSLPDRQALPGPSSQYIDIKDTSSICSQISSNTEFIIHHHFETLKSLLLGNDYWNFPPFTTFCRKKQMNSGNEGEMSCRGGADLHLTSHHPPLRPFLQTTSSRNKWATATFHLLWYHFIRSWWLAVTDDSQGIKVKSVRNLCMRKRLKICRRRKRKLWWATSLVWHLTWEEAETAELSRPTLQLCSERRYDEVIGGERNT